MTRLLSIIILCVVAFCFNKRQNGFVIIPGLGTKDLQVGKTKIKTAFGLLGKHDRYSEGVVDRINADALHINRYIYEKKGLKLITTTEESKGEDIENAILEAIEFEKPAIVSTDNSIVLGKSKIEEIIKVFGKPDDEIRSADVTFLIYSTKGISFLVDNGTNTLTKISVYQNNNRPAFDFY